MYNPQVFNKIRLDSPLASLVVGKSIIRMEGTFHVKNEEKLASKSIDSENFHIYIGSERLYIAHLQNITLPFGLGIHDDANQTLGGRMPSFSIFTL